MLAGFDGASKQGKIAVRWNRRETASHAAGTSFTVKPSHDL